MSLTFPSLLRHTHWPTWRLLWRWGRTACNKITDAGVGEKHSGSTRMLFQEADRLTSVEALSWNCWPNVIPLTCVQSCICAGAGVLKQCHMPFAEEWEAQGSCSLQPCSSGGSPSGLPGHDTGKYKTRMLQPMTTGGQSFHLIQQDLKWKIVLLLLQY